MLKQNSVCCESRRLLCWGLPLRNCTNHRNLNLTMFGKNDRPYQGRSRFCFGPLGGGLFFIYGSGRTNKHPIQGDLLTNLPTSAICNIFYMFFRFGMSRTLPELCYRFSTIYDLWACIITENKNTSIFRNITDHWNSLKLPGNPQSPPRGCPNCLACFLFSKTPHPWIIC